jgi:hypothetical protein
MFLILRKLIDKRLSAYFAIYAIRIKWNWYFAKDFDAWKIIRIRSEQTIKTSNDSSSNTLSTWVMKSSIDSKRQSIVTLFICEIEYTKQIVVAKKIIWLRNLMIQLTCDVEYSQTIMIYENNQKIIALIKNFQFHAWI